MDNSKYFYYLEKLREGFLIKEAPNSSEHKKLNILVRTSGKYNVDNKEGQVWSYHARVRDFTTMQPPSCLISQNLEWLVSGDVLGQVGKILMDT